MSRVLIVDRDAGFLAFAAEALHSFQPGFDVATARDLGEASEWLGTFCPDLLLLGPGAPEGEPAAAVPAGAGLDATSTMKVVRMRLGAPSASGTARPVTLPELLRAVREAMEH